MRSLRLIPALIVFLALAATASAEEIIYFTDNVAEILIDQQTEVIYITDGESNVEAKLDNLDGSREYDRWKAYGQSKLANLLFADERLQVAVHR